MQIYSKKRVLDLRVVQNTLVKISLINASEQLLILVKYYELLGFYSGLDPASK